MGWETANLHLGTPNARVAADLKRLPKRWLERGAVQMSRAVTRDWRDWTKRSRS
jgi:predicted alpha/beta hydrolase